MLDDACRRTEDPVHIWLEDYSLSQACHAKLCTLGPSERVYLSVQIYPVIKVPSPYHTIMPQHVGAFDAVDQPLRSCVLRTTFHFVIVRRHHTFIRSDKTIVL